MSEIEKEISTGTKNTKSFINYITTFDKEQKTELLNMIQYSVLAVIPIMLILRAVKAMVPEDDESKGSLEISAECVLQIIFMMVGIWLTDRVIRYIPTYSTEEYGAFHSISFIIPFLIILITMQSKLGFKLNILVERAMDKWHGKTEEQKQEEKNAKEAKNNNKVNYRIGNEGFATTSPPVHQVSQADYLDSNNLIGNNKPGVINGGNVSQKSPDFNSMYEGPKNPMIDANSPGLIDEGPLAANSVLGGSFGSAW